MTRSRLWVVALLCIHSVLLLLNINKTFITVNETMHLAAGLSNWRTGRFSVYRVNPPLPRMLASVPALAAAPRLDLSDLRDDPTTRSEVAVGASFVSSNRSRLFRLICIARLPGVVWSALGGWLIYRWASELHGEAAGRLGLVLWCVEPYVLGHAALITADVPASVAGLAATYSFRRYLLEPSLGRALTAGALLGVAALTKFTLLVLYVLWPAFWLASLFVVRRAPDGRRSVWAQIGHLFLMVAVSLDLINMGYLGQGSFQRLGDYPFVSRALAGIPSREFGPFAHTGNRFRGTWMGSVPLPLPEDYVRGIDVQRVDMEGRWPSYLAGKWRRPGWWYYYVYALAVKLPLGTIALFLWGAARTLARSRHGLQRADRLMPLAAAVTILVVVSSQSGYTQHSRYALPLLPFLMITASSPASDHRAFARRFAWTLCAASVLSSIYVYPHSLSYFNEAAGGPLRGHDHLVDSNIDWGQDLIHLKDWLEAHPEARPLRLAYFNLIDPAIMGIRFELPPSSLRFGGLEVPARNSESDAPRSGYYAVSVNFLRGHESACPDGRGGLHHVGPNEFAHFLAHKPIATAGYSIYIYNIEK